MATAMKRRPARKRAQAGPKRPLQVEIPLDADTAVVRMGEREVTLSNLRKSFWTEPLITKGQLLQYYADVAPVLLPHLLDRAMVMKRYPNGSTSDFFFMKRAPSPRPDWIHLCSIEHKS